jgi:hypothetical protein
MRPVLRKLTFAALLTAMINLSACAGIQPAPPLWEPGMYGSMAVLPMRVQIKTGAPPLTSEDSELTSKLSGTATEAASVALRYRGYRIFAPLEVTDRLDADKEMEVAFLDLAAASGIMNERPGLIYDQEKGAAAAAKLGEKLGVDILVLGRGNGEFHGFGENLVQGILTGILTDGKSQYDPPPSYLSLDLMFIDTKTGHRIARIYADRMTYADETIKLARVLDRRFGRIPRIEEQ